MCAEARDRPTPAAAAHALHSRLGGAHPECHESSWRPCACLAGCSRPCPLGPKTARPCFVPRARSTPAAPAPHVRPFSPISGAALSCVRGSLLQAKAGDNVWYDAKVVDTAGAGKKRKYLVHYCGWKSSSDEWLRSVRLRSHDAPKPELLPAAVWGADEGHVEEDTWQVEATRAGAFAVGALSGEHRLALARDPQQTFCATAKHICRAIRKLAAVATAGEVTAPLYRAVRGELPASFWEENEAEGGDGSEGGDGREGEISEICATDTAFMSTSRCRDIFLAYMEPSAAPYAGTCDGRSEIDKAAPVKRNVLWNLTPRAPSQIHRWRERGTIFCRGADISMLSQVRSYFTHTTTTVAPHDLMTP